MLVLNYFTKIFGPLPLILTFTRRQLKVKYMATVLGFFWMLATPLMLLSMYSFIFGYVFKPKWEILTEKHTSFVLFLFAGLIVFWIFAEVVNNSPGAIRSQVSLVKKVRFPIQCLPIVINLAAVSSWVANFLLLLCALAIFKHMPTWTILLAPLALFPLLFFTFGLSWLLAATGTYFKDVGQAAGVISLAGLFLSAVFFPLQAMPAVAQKILMFNPVAGSIEAFRAVVLYGELPDPVFFGASTGVGFLFMVFGRYVFAKVRGGFADVL
jgi:lipopolysaccharide transport system permease protein